MNKNSLNEVFTPSRPARLTYVDRSKVNDRIVRALRTPGMQVVVYGHSGSGKTTLLENVLFKVYERHIKTNCMKGMTYDQIITNAFDQLEPFYVIERSAKNKKQKNASLTAEYNLIKSGFGLSSEQENSLVERGVLPLQLTAQNLAKFIGAAQACWVLEDFHKIEESEKIKFSQMMKVFADLSDEYPDLKIIAIGAVNSAREVIKCDKEMQNRLSQIHVELMSDDEISQIVKKGAKLLNVEFSEDVIKDIIHSSNGLAAICHKLCFIMCDKEEILSTVDYGFYFDIEHLKDAIAEHIADNSDTMKAAFDKAYKLKDADKVMRVLSDCDSSGQTIGSMIDTLKVIGQKVAESRLREVLELLQTEDYGSNLIFDNDSCKYSFTNPFFAAFARSFFQHLDSRQIRRKEDIQKEMTVIFNQVIKSLVQKTLQETLSMNFSKETMDTGLIIDPR